MMPKIAILGVNGMLGGTVFKILKNSGFDIIGISRNELNAQTATVNDIKSVVQGRSYIINCIGIIKPYIHDDNSFDVERAISVNAYFPYKLSQCGGKIIQIATDCVYDGIKGNYAETDKHNAIDVYGKTKSLGEVNADNFMNLRCSIIGLEKEHKKSLLEWFLNNPKKSEVNGFKNHLWNGISTIAFAKICQGIIKNDFWFHGLQHIIPADMMNKANMLRCFSNIFCREDILIKDIDAKEAIDRTLSTANASRNKTLWDMAKYSEIPSIENLIMEIKEYG
jgi:dTDP-4-dehydrorhamnose reductase